MPYQEQIEEFRRSSGSLAFACIKNDQVGRGLFADALKQRAEGSHWIHQGGTPLCGPAAFMYCIAGDRRDDYVSYVLKLAQEGLGNLGGLTVKPSRTCRNASIAGRIHPVDWVALASLRDSSNTFRDVGGPDDNIASLTLGSAMEDWFRATGWFSGTSNNSFGLSSRRFDHLLGINQRVNSHICLLIRSAIIGSSPVDLGIKKFDGSGTPKTAHGFADHWIVLKGRLQIGNQTVLSSGMPNRDALRNQELKFRFWSSGDAESYPISLRIPKITPAQFVPYYYGYVSATR